MGAVSRRGFLAGSASVVATAAVVGSCASDGNDETVGTEAAHPAPTYVPIDGRFQSGVAAAVPPSSMLAAFDVSAADRDELAAALQDLTSEARRIMSGEAYPEREPGFPALYTGAVGNPPPPADLSVVVSVGASLFDDRFGLADRRPTALTKMPFLANDRLDPSITHGDVLVSIASVSPEFDLFALRQLMRATRGSLVLRWMIDGYSRRTGPKVPGEAGTRNLMGFVDGTANLATDPEVMDRYVWVAADDGEPDWAVGGSYHVVRLIRMKVEFWDRTRLSEQEALIGRRRATGAPLDGERETDLPDYAADPDGAVTPLTAHIRLANPRTAATDNDLIFRKGFSYSRGFDGAGQLDQGLAFVSYQRRLSQFLNTQARIAGEPLEEYILPVGGGFFFALPGLVDPQDWYARALLT